MKHDRFRFLALSLVLGSLPSSLLLGGCGDAESGSDSGTGGSTSSIGGTPGDGGAPGGGGSGGSGGGGPDCMMNGGEGGLGGTFCSENAGGSGGFVGNACPASLPEGDCELGDSLSCDGWLYPFVSVFCYCEEATDAESPQWLCWL